MNDNYCGDGGIPGYILSWLVLSEHTKNRLPVALAHETNHNIRFQFIKVAAMLGIHRNTVYNLIAKGLFKTERFNDRPRIDKESFEVWYRSQKHYLKVNA